MKNIYHRGGIALGGGDNVHKATAQITLVGRGGVPVER